MKTLKALLGLFLLLTSFLSQAAYGDPWYLMYKVSGGSLVQTMGPYSSKLECLSAKLNMPMGATFLGCAQ